MKGISTFWWSFTLLALIGFTACELEKERRDSGTSGIAVHDGSVYVSGLDYYGKGYKIAACYFVNGKRTDLTTAHK